MATITATILKISKVPSKFGGDVYYIFFKSQEGKSYKTTVASLYRNFRLWKDLVANPKAIGAVCEGMVLKSKGHIDADYLSKYTIPESQPKGDADNI